MENFKINLKEKVEIICRKNATIRKRFQSLMKKQVLVQGMISYTKWLCLRTRTNKNFVYFVKVAILMDPYK